MFCETRHVIHSYFRAYCAPIVCSVNPLGQIVTCSYSLAQFIRKARPRLFCIVVPPLVTCLDLIIPSVRTTLVITFKNVFQTMNGHWDFVENDPILENFDFEEIEKDIFK